MLASSTPLPNDSIVLPAPGTIIGGKYRIEGCLGMGGMGVVLSATHLDLDAPVAIKIVRDELAQNEDIVARLLFEARAAARMRSAHIVRVLDVARLENGVPYIVMEQLQGADLATLLAERGALSIPDAINYVLQVCEGLAEAHEKGIIHRDLKPENLFLATTPEGVVLKILDFGISKNVGTTMPRTSRSTLTKAGSAVGSPYYMSPEQMRASPDLDARADIWSLGAILFELVTGKCPFEGETPALLCAKVMVDEAPSLREFASNAPEELDRIVRRCLEKDANARFQSVGELAQALRAFLTSDPAPSDSRRLASGIDLKTDPPPEPPQAAAAPEARASTGKGSMIALCFVIVLLLIAGAAFWRLQLRPLAAPVKVAAVSPASGAKRPKSDASEARPVAAPTLPVVVTPGNNASLGARTAARGRPSWRPPQREIWPEPQPPPAMLRSPEAEPQPEPGPALPLVSEAPLVIPERAVPERVAPERAPAAPPVDPDNPALRYGL